MVKAWAKMALVSCHRRPDRSFSYRGRQFPVCARCTGIVVGYLAYPLLLSNLVGIGVIASLALQLPALIDGGTQYRRWRDSNNLLRALTGVLSGIGQAGLVVLTGRYLAQLVVSL